MASGAPCAGQELLLKPVADISPLLAGCLVVGACGFWRGRSGLGSLRSWLSLPSLSSEALPHQEPSKPHAGPVTRGTQ